MKYHKLSSILKRVKSIIEDKTRGISFWVTAEISNITFHRSGHCYLDLSETENDELKAQCKAIIWRKSLLEIEESLGSDTKNILKPGNAVLCRVLIVFSELYGFQLNILEVDLSFSLGNVEKQKQDVINRLTNESLINLNKQKLVPVVIQRIALVGSPNTSGFTDFREQLLKNQYGYCFIVKVFTCAVQGEKAEREIISCLHQVQKQDFDLVTIIRGGGSKLDLEVFNSYSIASSIAKCTLPIWTGIGHETDQSVCDLVANLQHKTPSAVASHIVEMTRNYEVQVSTCFQNIREFAERQTDRQSQFLALAIQFILSEPVTWVQRKRGSLHNTSARLVNVTNHKLRDQILLISDHKKTISSQSLLLIDRQRNKLKSIIEILFAYVESTVSSSGENLWNQVRHITSIAIQKLKHKSDMVTSYSALISAYDPKEILSKGYSIVRYKGSLLSDQKLSEGDALDIESKDRKIVATYKLDKK